MHKAKKFTYGDAPAFRFLLSWLRGVLAFLVPFFFLWAEKAERIPRVLFIRLDFFMWVWGEGEEGMEMGSGTLAKGKKSFFSFFLFSRKLPT